MSGKTPSKWAMSRAMEVAGYHAAAEVAQDPGFHIEVTPPSRTTALRLTALALDVARAAGYREGVEAAAKAVPTTWLDPLLSGDGKITDDWKDGRDVEALLRAVAERIRGLLAEGG